MHHLIAYLFALQNLISNFCESRPVEHAEHPIEEVFGDSQCLEALIDACLAPLVLPDLVTAQNVPTPIAFLECAAPLVSLTLLSHPM
jgi:hypothetical protein